MILYSKHAREQMVLRGINARLVEEAIKRGSKTLQSPGKVLYHYRYFVVVSKIIDNNHFIITVKPRW